MAKLPDRLPTKGLVSLRYRVSPPQPEQKSDTVENNLFEPVGVEHVDKHAQEIEKLVSNLRQTRELLRTEYKQFTSNSEFRVGHVDNLDKTLLQLRTKLNETGDWKLERPHRYKMQITMTSAGVDNETRLTVGLFNHINELCDQLVHSSNELTDALLKYKVELNGNKEGLTNFLRPDPQSHTEKLPVAGTNVHIKNQIYTECTYQTNSNTSTQLVKESEEVNQYAKQVFQALVNCSALYLVSGID